MDVIGIPYVTNKKADYIYDFGDYWEHSIVLEKILPKNPKIRYPCCIAVKRSSPPDDVGGISGFEEIVEIMKDSSTKSMMRWLNGIVTNLTRKLLIVMMSRS